MCIKLPCGYSSQTLAQAIACVKISYYTLLLILGMTFATILEVRPDFIFQVDERMHLTEDSSSINTTANGNETYETSQAQDILLFLDLPYETQTCIILLMIVTCVSGLVASVILLRGAQERHLGKVQFWFYISVLTCILGLPVLCLWIFNSSDPVNVICTCLMSYGFSLLCLSVVYAFMEELKIENISIRPGYKSQKLVTSHPV